ncbi:MAG: type II secretion system protein [Candidatus Riflebacteria bacterium]|nr:type II secretion system protein [Candidatus Riflebacteria bacterium]
MREGSGFSILEFVLALAIFAMAVLAFSPVFSQGISFTKDIRDYSILTNLGEELIHNYQVQIQDNIGGPPMSFFEEDITEMVKKDFPNPVFTSFSRFQVLGTVRPSLLCENNGFEIMVRIIWETTGRRREFTLFSVKAAPEA